MPVFVSTGLFLAVDVIFFSANSLKFPQGGWFPLLLASLTLFLTLTWRRGQLLLEHARARLRQSETELIEEIRVRPPVRLPGTVVFLSPARTGCHFRSPASCDIIVHYTNE